MRRRAMRSTRSGRLAAMVTTLAALGACAEARSSAEGAWEFHVDSGRSVPSPQARPAAWLRSVGKEGPQGEPQTRSAILSLDCRSDHTGAAILTEQALRQGTVEVEMTLDTERPRRLSGFAGTTSTGGQVVLTVSLDSVLDFLSGHERATVEYADGAGSSKTTAVFPVAGLETHRERFLAACGPADGERR